jgi:hypothetical protein
MEKRLMLTSAPPVTQATTFTWEPVFHTISLDALFRVKVGEMPTLVLQAVNLASIPMEQEHVFPTPSTLISAVL